MNDDQLITFYNLIAFGKFDQASTLIESIDELIDEPERIMALTLKIKQQLQKILSGVSPKNRVQSF